MEKIRKVLIIKNCEKTFEGDGVPVTRAFPVSERRENDPFLLFDHFGPINYDPGKATGVPAHPHCGFEAITYLLNGEIQHKDSWGGNASIKTGDIQWMTTGSGLIHSELATKEFKEKGGTIEGLQIWINLPKKNKKTKPSYQHINKNTIPIINLKNQLGTIKIIAGEIFEKKSIINTFSPVTIFDVQMIKEGSINLTVPQDQILMVYIIKGRLEFEKNIQSAVERQMIYFDQSGDQVILNSITSEGSYLILAGKPLNEPISRYGPFVANTENEIKKAMEDYQGGKMGRL